MLVLAAPIIVLYFVSAIVASVVDGRAAAAAGELGSRAARLTGR